MGNRLYTGFSVFEFTWFLLLRIAIIVGLVFIVPHYNENPPVISIATGVGLLFFLVLGDDQIIVYPDKIVQTTNSLWSLIFHSKATVYMISDIKAASLPPPASTEDMSGFLLLAFLLPKNSMRNRNDSHPIYLDLKDGKTVEIITYLGWQKMQEIVDTINPLIKKG